MIGPRPGLKCASALGYGAIGLHSVVTRAVNQVLAGVVAAEAGSYSYWRSTGVTDARLIRRRGLFRAPQRA